MKQKRREFLKLVGASGAIQLVATRAIGSEISNVKKASPLWGTNRFNMCGYAAPKIETVRIGFIGVGNRGGAAVTRVGKIDGIDIKAICDTRQDKLDAAKVAAMRAGYTPQGYTGNNDAWKKVCERNDIDLIYIATPWDLHTPMAVYAMKHGKHVCVEVPAATTVDECWELVETSENTKKHCMMLENCCYDFFEMLTLNMARQGFFGEIVHCEGAYIHDLLDDMFSKNKYDHFWRLAENANRNGNLYPTHGLGPICQILNINRGDQLDYLVSVSTNDFMMGSMQKKMAATDPAYLRFQNKTFRGNMNTSTIRTKLGKTIMLQHDVTSPRPYSRIHLVSGTKGIALKYPEPERIAVNHVDWVTPEEFKKLELQYQPPLTKKLGELAKQIGGHGGMDFLMDWRTIDCLRNGLPLDQDVYDAALWSVIGPLSEQSIKTRSKSMDVPDFTNNNWKTNKPVDIGLTRGGTTGVKVSVAKQIYKNAN